MHYMSFLSTSIFRVRSKESLVLYISMFVMGACGLAYQFTLSKVASDILGNSTRQWAIIIGVMMFFMGVGSDLQKYFSSRNLLDKFITAEIFLSLFGGFGPITLLYVFGTSPIHYVLTQYFFISIIGLIIGFEIPLITRINEAYTQELKLNLGGVLKMDYIGSLFGSLVWIFFLPKYFTMIQSAFILGLANLSVAALTLFYFRRLLSYARWIDWFLLLILGTLSTGLYWADDWSSYTEQYLYRDRIILSHTSKYQHIVLTKSRTEDLSCYINGNLQFNSFDEHIYHENLVHPAFSMAPNREKILILGGGDGLALREVLKYADVQTVTICDLDPAMTALAKQHPDFTALNQNSFLDSRVTVLENHALKEAGTQELYEPNQNLLFRGQPQKTASVYLIHLDASIFVQQISGVFDIIVIDLPDPNSLELSKLYSKTFYHHIAKKLAATGIMVQQSTSPFHAKEAFLCIGRTMRAAGLSAVPYHDNVPSFGEWGWWAACRSDRMTEEELSHKMKMIATISVPTQYLTPELISASLIFGKGHLESKNNDSNTILTNRVLEYYLKAWEHLN